MNFLPQSNPPVCGIDVRAAVLAIADLGPPSCSGSCSTTAQVWNFCASFGIWMDKWWCPVFVGL